MQNKQTPLVVGLSARISTAKVAALRNAHRTGWPPKEFVMSSKSYWQKLKDPRWQKLKSEIQSRAEFICEICFDSENTLHVHHKVYYKDRDPWEYDENELICLCASCHQDQHDRFDAFKWAGARLPLDGPFNKYDAAIIVAGFSGIDYEGFISLSGIDDNEYSRYLYSFGNDARGYLNAKS